MEAQRSYCVQRIQFVVFQIILRIVAICFFRGTLFRNKAAFPMKSTKLLCMSAPQLHQTVLPPSTQDKIFWCRGAFFFSRALRLQAFIRTLDNAISRPDWIQRHDLAEMRASLTAPLQNRVKNLIRGEQRAITDASIHTPPARFFRLWILWFVP